MPASPLTTFRTFNSAYSCMYKLGFGKAEAIRYGERYCCDALGKSPFAFMNVSSWPIPDDDIFLTPAELGKELGRRNTEAVNHLLAQLKLQKNISSNPSGHYWVLTDKGQVYGQIFTKIPPHTRSSARQIKWKRSVLLQLHRMLTS